MDVRNVALEMVACLRDCAAIKRDLAVSIRTGTVIERGELASRIERWASIEENAANILENSDALIQRAVAFTTDEGDEASFATEEECSGK